MDWEGGSLKKKKNQLQKVPELKHNFPNMFSLVFLEHFSTTFVLPVGWALAQNLRAAKAWQVELQQLQPVLSNLAAFFGLADGRMTHLVEQIPRLMET